jgi:endonuclease/exonuclease/phosphatase family metal-dependent hydrolase
MKSGKIIITCSVIIFSFTGCSNIKNFSSTGRNTFKIMSYNVRNCRGMDNTVNYKRVADIINRIAPDAVALQELDSATLRSNGAVVLDELASLTGMHKSYSASIEYQGGKYGVGILSREKPVNYAIIPLPGREEKRSLLVVELKNYIVCSTHFSLTRADRITSADIITDALKHFRKPVFLAGDLNAIPGSAEIKNLERNFSVLNDPGEPTIPSDKPAKCIDFILAANYTGHDFKVKRTFVEKEPVASDHLPVWVEVGVRKSR